MFKRSKTDKIKQNAASVSELALQLAQDKKFRKRLLSAVEHGSKAGRRSRRGQGVSGAARRLAKDQALHAELRSARKDLKQAYGRLEAKRRRHTLRRLSLLAGAASLAAVPQFRQRAAALIASASKRRLPLRPRTLDDLSREELYARAQEAEIPGRSEMSKQQLVEALRAKS